MSASLHFEGNVPEMIEQEDDIPAPPGTGQFAQKSLIYIFGNLLEKASQFLLIPLYTRLLSPGEYGFYGASIALTGVLIPLLDLGISSSLIRFIHEYADNPNRLLRYLKLSFWLRLASSLISSLFCGLLLYSTWNFLFHDKLVSPSIVVWIVLFGLGTTITEFVCAYYRATYQATLFVIGKVGQTFLQCTLVLIVLFFINKSATGVIAAQAIGACIGALCIALVFYIRTIYPARGLATDRKDIRYNLAFGVPLIPHQLGNWLRVASDRVILGRFAPLSAVGLYQLASSVGNVLGIFVVCMDMVYEPLYYRIRKRQEAKSFITLRSYNSCYLIGMGALCLFIIFFSGEIIAVLAPPAYALAARVTPLVIAAIYLQGQYTLVVKPLLYHKKTKTIPFLTLLPGAAGVLANFLLLPHFGLMAVVWVNLGVYLATFLAVFFTSRRVDNSGYPIVLGMVCNMAVLAIALFLTYYPIPLWELSSIMMRLAIIAALLATGWLITGKKEYNIVKQNLVW